ncbi:MAG: carbohydrate ABC transporter permease [Chloroflexi bacterium]|nr:carbohydrate ABC transporter permease [Chloroflexota bacterium]
MITSLSREKGEGMTILLKRVRSLGVKVILYGLLTFIAIFMMLPFIWMLRTSFMPQGEIFGIPPRLISRNMSLDGYRYIIEYGVLKSLRNTFFVAFSFSVVSLFFCSLGGYGFAKYRFPGRNPLFAFLLATMIIPGAVTMLPTYVIMLKLRWLDTFWPLIVPGAANAFGIFFMRQYIGTISDELIDAARIDGCGEFGIFCRIILPICAPGLTSLGLIFFMGAWNNYLGPLIYLRSSEKFTLPLFMMQMSGPPGYSPYRELMGVAVVSVVPLLIIFLIFQRRFTEGITAGAIKE